MQKVLLKKLLVSGLKGSTKTPLQSISFQANVIITMSAQTSTPEYYHIYNKGNNSKEVFKDNEDFETFLFFLSDYVSSPDSRTIEKKTFQVNGKVFQGIPHQPKNYFGKVDLCGYALLPNHYHLIIKELEGNAIERLMRSLSTRYVMYYNKKYQTSGPLFQATYKSLNLSNDRELFLLLKHIHSEALDSNQYYSSHENYLATKKVSWLNTIPLPTIGDSNNHSSYEEFMNSNITDEEKNLIGTICFEIEDIAIKSESLVDSKPKFKESVSPHHGDSKKPLLGFVLSSTFIFLLLFGFGVKNIRSASGVNNRQGFVANSVSPTPQVAGSSSLEMKSGGPTPTEALENTLRVIQGEDGDVLNIYELPSTSSATIRKLKVGETYKYVGHQPGWYEVELGPDRSGYIPEKDIEVNSLN